MTERHFDFGCCHHCGCPDGLRTGHDDTCRHGCNDFELEPPEDVTPLSGYTQTAREAQ